MCATTLREQALLLQLERHAEERLDEKWRALEKRAKKEAKKEGYVPPQERPEASFIASLVDEFVEVLRNFCRSAACESNRRFVDNNYRGVLLHPYPGGRTHTGVFVTQQRCFWWITRLLSARPEG